MHAMVLQQPGQPLKWEVLPRRYPGAGEIRIRVAACGVCRTDLHVTDGELVGPALPVIPGHEIVGRVEELGPGVEGFRLGERVGVPWLGWTCGVCPYCATDRENLCDRPLFNGYTRDGGFATEVISDTRYSFALGEDGDDAALAPLLCAGLIGWRSLKMAGEGEKLGLYGFGAAAHIIAQVIRAQGRKFFAFTRPGDDQSQDFARSLGATWAGDSDQLPPVALDAAILYAPDGRLIPQALKVTRKGGRIVCAGIHMSEIPAFSYDLLWNERQLLSVANLTRKDGMEFLSLAQRIGIRTHVTRYPLADANQALADLRAGRFDGAAVLIP
jgi:alcohol dehydrogenase, propanol-preferring